MARLFAPLVDRGLGFCSLHVACQKLPPQNELSAEPGKQPMRPAKAAQPRIDAVHALVLLRFSSQPT